MRVVDLEGICDDSLGYSVYIAGPKKTSTTGKEAASSRRSWALDTITSSFSFRGTRSGRRARTPKSEGASSEAGLQRGSSGESEASERDLTELSIIPSAVSKEKVCRSGGGGGEWSTLQIHTRTSVELVETYRVPPWSTRQQRRSTEWGGIVGKAPGESEGIELSSSVGGATLSGLRQSELVSGDATISLSDISWPLPPQAKGAGG